MINVTKTFLPAFDEYTAILKRSWDKAWITNNGELVQELEQKLKEFIGVKHLFFTNNGTVVLQMALKALGITKEVLTTPFSYVATTNAIVWEGCKPVYVDIDPSTYCIDPNKIEASITENTQAILATHVYGIPCAIEQIQSIAEKYSLKVIYDGAHAFGCNYKDQSLLSFGDISTCSFHATKLFHTVEGGCIICHDDEIARQLMLFRQFGHVYDDYYSVGINAKNSEFHAAMGLAVFPYIPELIEKRKKVFSLYYEAIGDSCVQLLQMTYKDFEWNYSYFPILFQDESALLDAKEKLSQAGFNTRRYFFPSLNNLPFLEKQDCPVAEDVSKRVLCLPFFPDLNNEQVYAISSIVKDLVLC